MRNYDWLLDNEDLPTIILYNPVVKQDYISSSLIYIEQMLYRSEVTLFSKQGWETVTILIPEALQRLPVDCSIVNETKFLLCPKRKPRH